MQSGMVTIDKKMSEDPHRWHLEGLSPMYNNPKEVEVLRALEELALGKGE